MRVYLREHACGFRYTREAWGELSNFHPLGACAAEVLVLDRWCRAVECAAASQR